MVSQVLEGGQRLSAVAVTGAGGYVGGRLVEALLQRAVRVVALTRRPLPYLRGARLVTADLLDPALDLTSVFVDVDAVVHLAGPNEVAAAADREGSVASAVGAARRVFDGAASAGVKRLVYLSTVHVYGLALKRGGVICEDTPAEPIHPYAVARLACEEAARVLSHPEAVILRLTNSVGAPAGPEVDRWTLVANDLCRQAATTGTLTLRSDGCDWRDFVPLGDVCAIVAEVAERGVVEAGTYNLGKGETMTIRDLAAIVQDAFEVETGQRPALRAPEPGASPPRYTIAVDRLRASGLRCDGSVADAVRETAHFCLEHRHSL